MDKPYGNFYYESDNEDYFVIYVTIPGGKLEVVRYLGSTARERGMEFFRKCIGVEV